MKLLITTQAVDINHPILGFFHGWILEFAKYFDEVHIICLQKGEYNLPEHVHVYSLGKEEGESRIKYTIRFYKYFWYIFFKVRVDYVFFHMGAIYNVMAAPFFFLRKLYKTKFYWWKTHGHINAVGHIALLFVDNVFTAIDESFKIKTNKKRVVGHAIDTDLFTYSTQKSDAPVLLFVGRIDSSKHVEHILQITSELKKKQVSMRTRIIGQKADKKLYEELLLLVEKLDIRDRVIFLGGIPHSQLLDEYRQAVVFINPSDNDGLDKVVLEAMVCGTVPLTGNASFEHVLSSYDLFMEKGNIDMYVEHVFKILHMSEHEYATLALQLASDVKDRHALTTLTKRIFNF